MPLNDSCVCVAYLLLEPVGYVKQLATYRSVQKLGSSSLGSDYVEFDKNSRRNFKPASIRAQIEKLSPTDKAIFEGYAAGFNARIQEGVIPRNHGRLEKA